jgi:DNA-directed RNA polymerase specialized sigma24 family protein
MNARSDFALLFKEQRLRLVRLSCNLGVSADVAVEIVQESFIALWQKIQDGEEFESDIAFLVTVTKNKTFNFLKTKEEQRARSGQENLLEGMQLIQGKSQTRHERETQENDRMAAREKAEQGAVTKMEGDIKVIKYPSVERVERSVQAIGNKDLEFSIDGIGDSEAEDFGSARLRENCVVEKIGVFERQYPEAGYAIKMQLDGIEIARIAEAINRTSEATRQYLYQIRKKLKDYLIECKEL